MKGAAQETRKGAAAPGRVRAPWFADRVEKWHEAFERAWRHVPLNLYDEDLKPAEYAFSEMLEMLEKTDTPVYYVPHPREDAS